MQRNTNYWFYENICNGQHIRKWYFALHSCIYKHGVPKKAVWRSCHALVRHVLILFWIILIFAFYLAMQCLTKIQKYAVNGLKHNQLHFFFKFFVNTFLVKHYYYYIYMLFFNLCMKAWLTHRPRQNMFLKYIISLFP